MAQQFVAFLSSIVPQRSKASRKVVSEDRQNNSHNNQVRPTTLCTRITLKEEVLVPTTVRLYPSPCRRLDV